MRSLMLIFFLAVSFYGYCQPIIIEDVTWTNEFASPALPHRYLDSIPIGRIGVWVKARCQPAAWETVKENGCLPIRFKWFKKSGGTWSSKGVDGPEDRIDAQRETIPLDSIRSDSTRGFYWYSWRLRKPPFGMSKGMWKVVVTTAENKPLAEAEILVIENP